MIGLKSGDVKSALHLTLAGSDKPSISVTGSREDVIEQWNSANGLIMYGKGGEFATNRLEDQEIRKLSLHLLQRCPVSINRLMVEQVLLCGR